MVSHEHAAPEAHDEVRYPDGMCRSIKTLRVLDMPASDDDIRAAALQFVRKVSGYRRPSPANELAFNHAVDEVAAASQRLLLAVTETHPARRSA